MQNFQDRTVQRNIAKIAAVVQDHAGLDQTGNKLQILGGGACQRLGTNGVIVGCLACRLVWQLVDDAKIHPRLGGKARTLGKRQLVANGYLMSGTHLACVLGVVTKVLLVQQTVFIADQTVGGNIIGIKGQLQLDVLGNRVKSAEEVASKHLFGFAVAVNIIVNAVKIILIHNPKLSGVVLKNIPKN